MHERNSMDSLTTLQRSWVMSRIKQRDTRLERAFRARLWREGVRYRKNVRIYGTPDLVISKARLLVFLDSCFWHGCRFHCRRPKSNIAFWTEKIQRNRERDRAVTRYYRRRGWKVLRFWEHQLESQAQSCLEQVLNSVDEAASRK